MLGLDEQIGGEPLRVGAGVGEDEALRRPEDHHRGDAVALHLDLRARDGRRAGTDDLAHLRDRRGAEAEGGDAGRSVGAEHVDDAELAAHHEHGRIHGPVTAGRGRHDDHDGRHAGDDRRHAELVHDARVAGLARRHEQADRGDGADLLADAQTRLRLEAPVGGARHQLLVERPAVGDRVVEGGVDLRGDGGRGDLVGGHPQLVRCERDPVEARQGVAHGGVAALADVLDERGDRAAQLGVEDVGQPAGAQRGACGLVHRRPLQPPHHRVHRRGRYRSIPSECLVHWSVSCGEAPHETSARNFEDPPASKVTPDSN